MKCFLNIKISQTATSSEPTTNTLFIKTQRKYTRKNNGQQHYEIIYYKHEKKLIIYSDNMKHAKKY